MDHFSYAANLFFDFSRSSKIDDYEDRRNSWSLLIDQGFEEMFQGNNVNFTENRPALHFQSRKDVPNDPLDRNTSNHFRFLEFASHFSSDPKRQYTQIETVVNIGIGGSHLGPEMLSQALSIEHEANLTLKFLSNLDPEDFRQTFKDLIPEKTLVIVASKTFTTFETLSNLELVKNWFEQGGASFASHAFAVTSNPQLAVELGFSLEHIFEFEQTIGGRFSISSSVGLAIALGYGHQVFRDFLIGMNQIDALVENDENCYHVLKDHIFNFLLPEHYLNQDTVAILPYSHGLVRLPAFLQQLFMESLGKSINRDGNKADHSGIVIFGEAGTGNQHSFMQLLHQGNKVIPAEFIIVKPKNDEYFQARRSLALNAIAQAEALFLGNLHLENGHNGDLHKSITGGRPSRIIGLQDLSAFSLGNLIAWYEHVVVGIGFAWGINPFDQWGVELGKHMARELGSGSAAKRKHTVRLISELGLTN